MQEYSSGLPCPSLGDLPNPEIEPGSPASQAGDSLPSEPPGKPYCKVGKDYTPSSHQFQMKDFFFPKFLTKVWGMNLSGPTHITSHSLTNDCSQRREYSN